MNGEKTNHDCDAVYEYNYGGLKDEPLKFPCGRRGPHTYHRASLGLTAQLEWIDAMTFVRKIAPQAELAA